MLASCLDKTETSRKRNNKACWFIMYMNDLKYKYRITISVECNDRCEH